MAHMIRQTMGPAIVGGAIIVGAAIIYVAGFGLYLDRKLKPIREGRGVQLRATPFTPVDVAKKRVLNLGYIRCSIPASLGGDPVNLDKSGVIGVGTTLPYPLVFFPPQSDSDADVAAILANVSRLVGEPIRRWFDLEKRALAQQPFSVWEMPVLGKRKTAARALLLLVKGLSVSQARSVRIFENDRRGLIICDGADFTHILVADFRSGVLQRILVTSSLRNVDEVISAIVNDYEVLSSETDIDAVKRLIAGAGIKSVPVSAPDQRDQMPATVPFPPQPIQVRETPVPP